MLPPKPFFLILPQNGCACKWHSAFRLIFRRSIDIFSEMSYIFYIRSMRRSRGKGAQYEDHHRQPRIRFGRSRARQARRRPARLRLLRQRNYFRRRAEKRIRRKLCGNNAGQSRLAGLPRHVRRNDAFVRIHAGEQDRPARAAKEGHRGNRRARQGLRDHRPQCRRDLKGSASVQHLCLRRYGRKDQTLPRPCARR